jgi:ribose transport system ATP-binding protein
MSDSPTPVDSSALPQPKGRGSAEGLALRNVSKRYGDTQALDSVSLAIRPGEVVGVVGHNGAGKSTVLRMLTGAERPDSGSVLLDGVVQSFTKPREALDAGISAVYQELALVSQLTVAQSIFLGQEEARRGGLSKRAMFREAQELCDEFEIGVRADALISSLPVAQRQLIEIVSAFHRESRFLLLDEPTTALEARQITHLFNSIRLLVANQNFAVVLIDHKLDEIFAVADRVVAMADGQVVIDGPVGEVDRVQVVAAIVGDNEAVTAGRAEHRTISVADRTESESSPLPVVGSPSTHRGLVVEDVQAERLPGVSLAIEPGRVVALYGLMGSGRSRFLRVLAGVNASTGGVIRLDGKEFRPKSPRDAQRAGVVYVSEERKADGIIPSIGIVENVTLPVLGRYTTLGIVRKGAARSAALEVLNKMDIRGDLTSAPATLSGGNQQKLLLARTLLQDARLLLLDEPTKGVDIGAKAEIHALVRAMADEDGRAVLVVSSEEEEILALADDVAIFRRGHCTGVLHPTTGLTVPALRRLALVDAEATDAEESDSA